MNPGRIEATKSPKPMIARLKTLLHLGAQQLTTKTISDEYINWLTFANAGMLTKGNIYAMRFAIENLPSGVPVVEIGSFCGLSANVISYLLKIAGKNNKIFCCDKWIFEGSENGPNLGNSQISHKDYRNFVKSSFIRNIEFFSPDNKPFAVEQTSDEFFLLWQKHAKANDIFGRTTILGGEIAFAYIDGNHTYEFAKRDFKNIDKSLELGGFILFDDSSDADPFGLSKLMKEIKHNSNYQVVMKNPNYLFKKIA
ncbi:class I SAM-dependent methyltransferase [Cyanobium sp. ATX 6A2]|nr:class I SAM-dependent methyltransferase [Cyanobium sp. ATX 6A2]